MSQPENTQLTIGEVKYHFTAGLHFDWLGFSNFITYKKHIFLFGRIQSSQTGNHSYSDTCPTVSFL